MYQFSRSIYRELAPRIDLAPPIDALESIDEAEASARHQLLKACEATIRRLASDHRYFARPAQTLFTDVRDFFSLSEQVRVYLVIERYIDLALQHIESLPDNLTPDGRPRQCSASTRRGTPCQREPRPGSEYCPSHRHLDEMPETLAAAA
jgi:hypothetical protein